MQDPPYSDRILQLAEKWTNGTITETEQQEFIDWYNRFDDENLTVAPGLFNSPEELKLQMLQAIRAEIRTQRKRTLFSLRNIAAAAVLLLMATGGAYLFFAKDKKSNVEPATAIAKIPADISAPQSVHATLQLADGKTIFLDRAKEGSLALQGNVHIEKQPGGQLVYKGAATEMQYNTLTNPKGSKAVPVTLSDGTTVWLNAASSLRYPVAFVGNTREVQITGEAYFEVAHDPSKPFTVKDLTNDVDVQVLGTHFDINTYRDAGSVKVTLLQGSVKLRKGASYSILAPGQQARITEDIKLADDVDIEQVMAWKNGLFKFDGEELHSIMKQIERWYNVEVVYQGVEKPLNFGGIISRKENVSAVLDLMALTKQVKFKIQPSETATAKIIVMQ